MRPIETPAIEVEPAEIVTEVEGFKVGDRVKVSVDQFPPEIQREMIKLNEAPVGAVGVVRSFHLNPTSLLLGRRHWRAAIDVQGVEHTVSINYLQEVAA